MTSPTRRQLAESLIRNGSTLDTTRRELGHVPTKVTSQYADHRPAEAASDDAGTSAPSQETAEQGSQDEETQ
ncbi:hypothetical protein ACO0M4_33680 [Streptomyces sp. RGM 3693]|uniref:hypothetical protein n=1 Tax=Streptomyces sp. RGM 3693 TaxID=3413284 RepID=UPI003D29F1D6